MIANLEENIGRLEEMLRATGLRDNTMRAGLPPHKGEVGSYPEGAALPIAKARLRIAGTDRETPVGPDDREAVFTLTLGEGRTKMQTWFYDSANQEISGAYYVYVERH